MAGLATLGPCQGATSSRVAAGCREPRQAKGWGLGREPQRYEGATFGPSRYGATCGFAEQPLLRSGQAAAMGIGQ